MPALFGYLVAVSMLLGGAYAGLQWLSAPASAPAEKSAAHSNNAPERPTPTVTGAAAAPNAVDRERNAGTPAKTASTEPSDQIGRQAKHGSADTTDESSNVQKADGVAARGCAPIGLTASGDFVFSMQCQDIIDRHRGELSSPEAAQAAPASEDQAARSAPSNTGSNDGGKAVAAEPSNHDARDKATNELAARDATGPGNRAGPNTDEVARREPNKGRAQPTDQGARRTSQDAVTTRESRSSGPNPEIASGKSAKQKRPRAETTSRTAAGHDAPREQRSSPGSRSRSMAARADSELWYNVLGLR